MVSNIVRGRRIAVPGILSGLGRNLRDPHIPILRNRDRQMRAPVSFRLCLTESTATGLPESHILSRDRYGPIIRVGGRL